MADLEGRFLSELPSETRPLGVELAGRPRVSVYSAAVPLAPGKTVRPVTLPAVSHGVGGSLSALYVFAMGIGGLGIGG